MRLSLLLAAALLLSPAALAASILVTTLDDELNADGDCSLREAVEAANTDAAVDACASGDGRDWITFDASDGAVLTLSLGELVVASDIWIGASSGPAVGLVAGPEARLIRIASGLLRLDRVDLWGGQAERGGAVLMEAGAEAFDFRNAQIATSEATAEGGGAVWIGGGAFSAAFAEFDGNRASGPSGQGGALVVAGGTISFRSEVSFAQNEAVDGGAIAVLGGSADLSFAQFSENAATQRGGALFVKAHDGETAPYAFLQVTQFSANTAQNGGAVWAGGHLESRLPAIATQRGGDPYGRSVFEGNTASGNGGAIYLADPATTLEGISLMENVAGGSGGGLYVANGSSVRVERSVVSGNQAGAANFPDPVGAGIAVMDDPETEEETNLWIVETWIDGNRFAAPGTGLGGGIYAIGQARAQVAYSTVSNNRALDGGGVWSTGDLYLENATLTQNTADASGGAVYLDVPPGEFSEGFAQFATIAENEAGVSGGGIGCPIEEEPSDVCFGIGSTILTENRAGGLPSDCSGRVGAGMDVLVGLAEGCISVAVTAGTFIEGEDPMLLPLAFNGGWTPTMALQSGSPAEDVIQQEPYDPLDQRGFLRPGWPDLGAYEIAGIELENEADEQPARALRLNAPAPNPAAGRVAIGFSLPAAGPARLVLHDVLGREVLVIQDGVAAAEHEASLDVQGLAPGLYVLRLVAGGQQATRKLTVVR